MLFPITFIDEDIKDFSVRCVSFEENIGSLRVTHVMPINVI